MKPNHQNRSGLLKPIFVGILLLGGLALFVFQSGFQSPESTVQTKNNLTLASGSSENQSVPETQTPSEAPQSPQQEVPPNSDETKPFVGKPASAEIIAALAKAPRDLSATDCKAIDRALRDNVKEVSSKLNQKKESEVSAATRVDTIRGACLKLHKVGIPFG